MALRGTAMSTREKSIRESANAFIRGRRPKEAGEDTTAQGTPGTGVPEDKPNARINRLIRGERE